MQRNQTDDLIHKSYREDLRRGIDWDGVRADKISFVRDQFPQPAPFILRLAVAVPALMLAVILAWVGIYAVPFKVTNQAVREKIGAAVPMLKPAVPHPIESPSVKVKRLSSQVGPVMVYQKAFESSPVTVIWVFQGTRDPALRGARV